MFGRDALEVRELTGALNAKSQIKHRLPSIFPLDGKIALL